MVHQNIQPIMETATCMDDATPKRALKQCKMDTYALVMTHQNKRKNTFKLVKNRLRQQNTSTTFSPRNRCTGHGSRAKTISRRITYQDKIKFQMHTLWHTISYVQTSETVQINYQTTTICIQTTRPTDNRHVRCGHIKRLNNSNMVIITYMI